MTWKERKKIEDRNIVSLGGKVFFIFYFDNHVSIQILLQGCSGNKILSFYHM